MSCYNVTMKIILPDFLLHTQGLPLPALDTLSLPALTILMRGSTSQDSMRGLWQHVCADNTPLPMMAPMLLKQDLPLAQPGYWLRADPVLLRPGLNNLLLLPGERLAIEQSEADALIDSLNTLFNADGITFYAPAPTRWYAHLTQVPQVEFVELDKVLGRQIDGLLPMGKDALVWHRYLNEIQMLFYTHPVNEARASAKRQLISSVWFWGAGMYPFVMPARQAVQIYCDDVSLCREAQALGHTAAVFAQELPPITNDQAVWVISALTKALRQEGVAGWLSALQQVETLYLQPAVQALKNRQVQQIECIFPSENQTYYLSTSRSQRWKIWHAKPRQWMEKISV